MDHVTQSIYKTCCHLWRWSSTKRISSLSIQIQLVQSSTDYLPSSTERSGFNGCLPI